MTKAALVEANGARIPCLGLGTWTLRDDACADAVRAALDAGYRHIDTAAMYGNEEAVGAGLKASGVARDEIFVTTKVWHGDLAPDDLRRSAEASLRRLGLSQVDLLLIHWPNSDVPLGDTLRALSGAKRQGLTRHIGVSNFSASLVEEAVRLSAELLVVNQCEYHPYLDQSLVRDACRRHGLAFTSYCPLGKGDLIDDPAIQAIAAEHGKTPAQVILRWHVQQPATIAIPKSGNRNRIAENLHIFDFALSQDEMRRISGLARPNGRMVYPSWRVEFD
ncbi:aldo/keto reductase [Microvirga subterranea]|uniref:Diketogulonate reductase-like aldo/keto reductase n=1 Tax=Microvirga subterranea TaxID=186651 RepID=A0A370HTI5_9HYPH|nr:aldo/keto reductase [Microvirga subterranea]RDI61271.1 diketogulonate reductase-like aldo/keto reductase [Microvirga subterranea]